MENTEADLTKVIGNYMGLDLESEISRFRPKIETILQYAKSQTEDHSPEGLRQVIQTFETKLGSPPHSERKISWLSRNAWLRIK